MKTIKFTEKELSIIRALDIHDICRHSCFDPSKQAKSFNYCENCWVQKTIESILEKVREKQ